MSRRLTAREKLEGLVSRMLKDLGKLNRAETTASERIRKMQVRVENTSGKIRRRIDEIFRKSAALLQEHAELMPEGRKSVKVGTSVLAFKQPLKEVKVENEEALLRFLLADPELDKAFVDHPKPKIKWGELRKAARKGVGPQHSAITVTQPPDAPNFRADQPNCTITISKDGKINIEWK